MSTDTIYQSARSWDGMAMFFGFLFPKKKSRQTTKEISYLSVLIEMGI